MDSHSIPLNHHEKCPGRFFAWWTFSTFIDIPKCIYILYHIYYLSLYSMVIFIYTLHFIWLVVDLPILKNMSSSMVGGWHPIYEMENNPAIIQPCSKPPTSYGMYPLQYTNIEKRQKQWDTIPKLTVTIAGINPENMGALLFLY